MAGDLTVYGFDKVKVVFGGVEITGFWSGSDAVSIEDGEDVVKTMVGAGGDALVSVMQDASVMVTLKLQHTGAGHSHMTDLHRQAKLTGSVQPKTLSVTEIGTGEGTFVPKAVLLKPAKRDYGDEASVREWQIFGARGVPSNVVYQGA